MTHRHYGVPVSKPHPTDTGPTRAAALSGGAFIGGIVVVMILLGVVLYGVSKIVRDAGKTTTPSTIGQGAQRP
jgi:hypothetical protein